MKGDNHILLHGIGPTITAGPILTKHTKTQIVETLQTPQVIRLVSPPGTPRSNRLRRDPGRRWPHSALHSNPPSLLLQSKASGIPTHRSSLRHPDSPQDQSLLQLIRAESRRSANPSRTYPSRCHRHNCHCLHRPGRPT